MNALLCLNLNDYLCANARRSFEAAARRWGCELVVWERRDWPDHHPTYEKFNAMLSLWGRERVLFLDSDMLIDAAAPSPFRAFADPAKIYACTDTPDHLPPGNAEAVRENVHRPYFAALENHFRFGLNEGDFVADAINGGVLLLSPACHAGLLRALAAQLPLRDDWGRFREAGHFEQALVNYLAPCFADVELIDPRWNYLWPDPTRTGHAFVHHFTGWGFADRDAVKTFDWEGE